MSVVIISIVIIISLVIKKIDSIVSNEKILNWVNKWQMNVKSNMLIICTSPYKTIARKTLGKWLGILFIILAVINYLSIAIFGNSPEGNIFENIIILYISFFLMVVLVGLISNKKDNYLMIIFLLIAIILTGYLVNQEMNNTHQNIEFFKKTTFWIAFVIASISIILLTILISYIYKLIAYLFYLFLKYYFKLCIYLNPQKPLKPLVFMIEMSIILLVPIFHLIK